MSISQKVTIKKMSEQKKSSLFTMKFLIIGLVLLLLVTSSGSAYFYKKYSTTKKQDPQQELIDTIADVSKLMVLPTNETPTLATVSDPEKLKDQAFFAQAKVGDKVLIYTQARKAILYSPSKNMIIEVSPLNINSQ